MQRHKAAREWEDGQSQSLNSEHNPDRITGRGGDLKRDSLARRQRVRAPMNECGRWPSVVLLFHDILPKRYFIIVAYESLL
jgi:hypothetical protein